MPQTNDAFIMKTFDNLGFGDYFNAAYLKGKEAKLAEIPFEPGKLDFGGTALVILPKVVEEKKLGDGFYVMKGFHATRMEEGKPDVSQFLPVYKTIGFNVDQANELLRGSAVRHLTGYKDNSPQFAYSQINFLEKTENDNFKMMKRSDDGSLVKTLGTIGIIARQEEKEDIYQRLQKGERVAVNVRVGDSSKRLQIQAAVLKIGPGIDLFDGNGTLLKQYPEAVLKRMQPLKSLSDEKPVSAETAKIVTQTNNTKPLKEKKIHM